MSLLDGPKYVQGVVRVVNYSITDTFQYVMADSVIRTRNFWVNFKKDPKTKALSIKSCYEIVVKVPVLKAFTICGLEDIRILPPRGKRLYGLAVTFEYTEKQIPSIVLLHLTPEKDGRYAVTRVIPAPYHNELPQKNWAPFWYRERLCAIYAHDPLKILEIDPDTGACSVFVEKVPRFDLRLIKGSAPPLLLKNGEWLVLVHGTLEKNNDPLEKNNDTRKYYHRFLRYSESFDLVGVSDPFHFGNFFIEFSMSVYLEQINGVEMLQIPFSTRDNTSELATFPLAAIPWITLSVK